MLGTISVYDMRRQGEVVSWKEPEDKFIVSMSLSKFLFIYEFVRYINSFITRETVSLSFGPLTSPTLCTVCITFFQINTWHVIRSLLCTTYSMYWTCNSCPLDLLSCANKLFLPCWWEILFLFNRFVISVQNSFSGSPSLFTWKFHLHERERFLSS